MKIEIDNSPRHVVGLVVAALGFAVLGIAFVTGKLGNRDGVDIFVGWMSIVFGGGAAAAAGWRLTVSRPRLILDDRGLSYAPWGTHIIPWCDIVGVSVREIESNAYVCLELRNSDKHLRQASFTWRAFSMVNFAFGLERFTISLTATECTPDELLELIIKAIDKFGVKKPVR
jgi:hypothetical protein